MARRKGSSTRRGPNPKDQHEEREARITQMLEHIRRHNEQAKYHLEQANQHQREAERHIERAARKKADKPQRPPKRR